MGVSVQLFTSDWQLESNNVSLRVGTRVRLPVREVDNNWPTTVLGTAYSELKWQVEYFDSAMPIGESLRWIRGRVATLSAVTAAVRVDSDGRLREVIPGSGGVIRQSDSSRPRIAQGSSLTERQRFFGFVVDLSDPSWE